MSGVIEYTLRAGFGIRTELASTESGISYMQIDLVGHGICR